jgi:FkbM family methyltransferase
MLSGFPLLSRICGHTFVADFIPNSPVIVDLGMNEGSFTRGIRGQFPGARVFGCEPVPDLFQDLAKVMGDSVFNVAVGGKNGQRQIAVYKNHCASLEHQQLEPTATMIPVKVVPFDQLVADLGLTHIDLLKVDIEGSELDMLRDCPAKALQMCDQISVEFHDFLDPASIPDIRACMARLHALGFRAFRCSLLNRSDVLFVHARLLPRWRSVLATRASVMSAFFTAAKLRSFVAYLRGGAGRAVDPERTVGVGVN